MYTCYECGRTIKGAIKQVGLISAERMTGWNYQTGKPCNMGFPKAYHQACYDKLEAAAIIHLAKANGLSKVAA